MRSELEKLISEIQEIENMYLDKKEVLKRLKIILKNEYKTKTM